MIKVPKYKGGPVDAEILAETVDYGAQLIKAPESWLSTKGLGIRVGILDTGFPDHEDVSPAVRKRFHTTQDIDQSGHGTHVAGIIGARENGVGVVGIAPRCSIVSLKCVPGSWDEICKCLERLIRAKVDVINMSFGSGNPPSARFLDLLEICYQKGIVVVAAAGNSRVDGKNTINYPARCNRVIPVAAIGPNAADAPFSATGDELEKGFAMPGVQVYSTWTQQQYAKLSGTSMAAPHLTGVVALLLAKHWKDQGSTPISRSGPTKVDQVIEHLVWFSVNVGDPKRFGHGYIDLSKK